MKIAIDGTFLTQNNNAGPENYVKNLVESMFLVDSTSEYIIYTSEDNVLSIPPEMQGSKKVTLKKVGNGLFGTQAKIALSVLTDKPNVLFCPFHKAPMLLLPLGIKPTLMIHGLEYASNNLSFFQKLIPETQLKILAKYSNNIIVPSRYVNEKLQILYKVDKTKIKIVPEGVSKKFFSQASQEEIESVRNQYSIKNKYILAVSTIQPRKNYNRLILAFSNLCRDPDFTMSLVICGKYGWGAEDTLSLPEKLGIKDRVIFTGRVDDSYIAPLYQGSTITANVSLEEGFGLPLLEAMASKKPLVISNLKPYKDLAQENAVYVNPHDAESIEQGLKTALQEYDHSKLENACNIALGMSWERSATEILTILKSNY